MTDQDQILALLDEARRSGFAATGAECWDGALAIAAPVFDYTRRPIAAVSISVPASTWTLERTVSELAPVIKNAAAAISRDLGFAQADAERVA